MNVNFVNINLIHLALHLLIILNNVNNVLQKLKFAKILLYYLKTATGEVQIYQTIYFLAKINLQIVKIIIKQ